MGKPWNPFDCDTTCRRQDGSWNDRQRSSYGCTRQDLPAVGWDVDVTRVCFHLGRPRERSYTPPPEVAAGIVDAWKHPLEEPEDGCPGGDQRCRFVDVVLEYVRPRAGDGRVPNPLLDRCNDSLLVQAVLFYEQQEQAAASARQEHDFEVMDQKGGK